MHEKQLKEKYRGTFSFQLLMERYLTTDFSDKQARTSFLERAQHLQQVDGNSIIF